jgi:predicted nucleotidyltransferase
MRRDEVIATLREHESELHEAGVIHLLLHGSYARETQAGPLSDVDLIAEFDSTKRLTLLDLVEIENRLKELLGVCVDLSDATRLKGPVRRKVQREAVLAF